MKKLYLLAAALLTFASCSNEEEILNDIQQNDYQRIAAIIEQGATDSRGAIDANNTFSFFDGEVIRIFVDDPDMPSYDYKYDGGFFVPIDAAIPAGTTILGAYYGGTDGEEGDYPYASGSLEGNKLDISLPQNTQFLYNPNHNVMLPLWGNLNGNGLYFKHLAGVLRVSMSNLPEDYEVLAVHSSNPMSGDFVVQDITVDEPFMEGTGSGENAEGLMTIQFPATTANTTDKTLYIPLPVGTYQNIQVLVSKDDEDCAEGNYNEAITLAYWENKEVERATIYTANLDCNQKKNNLALIKSAFANGGYLTLTEDVTLDEPLTVANGKTVKLNLNGFTLTTSGSSPISTYAVVSEICDITNEGTLIIQDGTIQSENIAIKSTGNLKLDNCDVSTSSNKDNTIKVTGGTFEAEGSELTNTATNVATDGKEHYVLCIENAVAKLYESVEIRSDNLGAIYVAGNSTLSIDGGTYRAGNFYPLNIIGSTVDYTGSATFYQAPGNNVIIHATAGSTLNGETLASDTSIQCISTLAELQSAFSTGGIYKLVGNISLDATLTLASGKSLTLDMSNGSLVTTVDLDHIIINEGTLTLKDAVFETAKTAIWSKSGKLTLSTCVLITPTNRVNALTVTGGTLMVEGGTFMNNVSPTDGEAPEYVISLKDVTDAQIKQAEIHGGMSMGGISVDNSVLNLIEGNCMAEKFYAIYLTNASKLTYDMTNISSPMAGAHIFASAGCTVNGTLYNADEPLVF